MNRRTKQIIVGMLAEYYSIPSRIEAKQEEINTIRQRMGVKSVSFDSLHGASLLTHDEKLNKMTFDIIECEKQIDSLKENQKRIFDKLHMDELSNLQKEILKQVYTTGTYKLAGNESGYSIKQIYRIINKIYSFMEQFV